MKIANWNIERLSKRKRELVTNKVIEIDADIFVFTESTSLLKLDKYESVHSEEFDHRPNEQWISIFSKYPIKKQVVTFNGNRTCCAIINSPLGNVIIYGTIIPYHNAGVSGDRYPVSGYKPWEYHCEDIERQSEDWKRIKQLYPNLPFVLIGDFNQVRDGEKRGYKTKKGNDLLSQALVENDLVSLTDFSFENKGLLSINPKTGKVKRNIDHICISKDLMEIDSSPIIGAWDQFSDDGKNMSDHNGVYVTIRSK